MQVGLFTKPISKYVLKLLLMVKILKKNKKNLDVKDSANEDNNIFLFKLIFLENIKIYLYLKLFLIPLEYVLTERNQYIAYLHSVLVETSTSTKVC